MLVLGIKEDEKIRVGEDVVLQFRKSLTGGGWRIVIAAPKSVEVKREKISSDSHGCEKPMA